MSIKTKVGRTIAMPIPSRYYRWMELSRTSTDKSNLLEDYRDMMERLAQELLDYTPNSPYRTGCFRILGWSFIGHTVYLQETDNPNDMAWIGAVIKQLSDKHGMTHLWDAVTSEDDGR